MEVEFASPVAALGICQILKQKREIYQPVSGHGRHRHYGHRNVVGNPPRMPLIGTEHVYNVVHSLDELLRIFALEIMDRDLIL